ncbi:MAG TPA: ABC transporter permease subunit, partial [Anaerolineales bacterium]
MKSLIIFKRKPVLIFPLIIVLALIILSLFGEKLAPYDPLAINIPDKLHAPQLGHIMGTDEMGRDVLSRIMTGTRYSTETVLVIMSSCLLIGILVGTIAGYFGGRVDEALMRITDIFLAVPPLILALAI